MTTGTSKAAGNSSQPAQAFAVSQRYVRWSIIVVGLVALGYLLSVGKSVIIPFLFAWLLAMLLDPLATLLERWHVPRALGILVSLLLAMALLLGISWFIATQTMRFTETLPGLEAKLNDLGREMQQWVRETFDMGRTEAKEAVEKVKSEGMERGKLLMGQTLTTMGTLFAFLFLLPVFTFLIMYYKRLLLSFVARVFPANDHEQVQLTLWEMRGVMLSYLVGLIVEAGLVMALTWGGLVLLGVPYALLLAVIAAVLNLIPYIGMLIATALPALVALATMEPIYALLVLALYAVVQFIDNNIIVPRVVGGRIRLNALVSLIAVMVGGAIWDVPGMFLALPMAALLKVAFDHAAGLEAFGFLLGDEQPVKGHRIFKRTSGGANAVPETGRTARARQ